jgi:glucose/arabinose dehydrogenase
MSQRSAALLGACVLGVLALAFASAGCSTAPTSTSTSSGSGVTPACLLVPSGYGPSGAVAVRAETVFSGLEVPWGIAFLPDGDWLVTERPGRVRRVTKGQLLLDPVTTIDVHASDEGGLLGIAVSPKFTSDRFFYVYGTFQDSERHNKVLRYKLSPDKLSATLDKVVLDRIPGAMYHDGGRLRFGPDGMLYVGTGDARVPELSQNLTSVAGKLLRLTPDGGVPPDNPFAGSPVFLSGIRNLQAFDWLNDKTLALADHGPSGELGRTGHDEIDVAKAGQNLGWPLVYGCESRADTVTPVLTFQEAVPPGGAVVYKGTKIPEWTGSFLVATLRSKHLHRVVVDPSGKLTLHEVYLAGEPPSGEGRLRDIVVAPDGELYVTTSNCDGRGTCPPERDRILRVTRK